MEYIHIHIDVLVYNILPVYDTAAASYWPAAAHQASAPPDNNISQRV